MSADITAAARPKRLSLASAIASASLSNGRIQTTGPKISSHHASASSGTSVSTVGATK
ncbi:MAG: hypothetical protein ACD_54C01208G0002 [uncultured bacterium]|nr:MAG: hypothetical protein ACD_54C01208G0002 [uncultured bacterium]